MESLKLEEHREFNQIHAIEYLAMLYFKHFYKKKCLITIHFHSRIRCALQTVTIQIVLMTYQKVFTKTHRPICICRLVCSTVCNCGSICFYIFLLCIKKYRISSYFFMHQDFLPIFDVLGKFLDSTRPNNNPSVE